jgi:chemotaxis protein CheX
MTNNADAQMILEIINKYVPEVMQTMAGLVAVPGNADLEAPQPASLSGIVGAIGLTGRANGVVYTAFSQSLANLITEKILGGEPSSQDVSDVVGELTNMITGNVKSQLCDAGFNCSLSIPSVVRGDKITVASKSAAISVRNEYQCEGLSGQLVLQVFAVLEK